MEKAIVNKKDDIVMKLIHYFITEENYKPIVISGIQNEIWLENLDSDLKLIRVNINYIHNKEQFEMDIRKCETIRKTIKKKTYLFSMDMLNILVDYSDDLNSINEKGINTVKIKKIGDVKTNKIICSYFPKLKEKINYKKANMVDMFKMTDELNEKTEKEEKKLAGLFKKRTSYLTYFIIAINILIYILMLQPNIYRSMMTLFSCKFEFVSNGEIYRLVSAIFMHETITHIFFNMYALYIVGPEIERYYGKLKFLVIYFASGIFGCIFSCLFSDVASIGASGAIFGLFGALLYFALNYRATLENYLKSSLIPLILINLVIGLFDTRIDVFAHFGGLIGGFLVSMAIGLKTKTKRSDKINGLIMTAILLLTAIYLLIKK